MLGDSHSLDYVTLYKTLVSEDWIKWFSCCLKEASCYIRRGPHGKKLWTTSQRWEQPLAKSLGPLHWERRVLATGPPGKIGRKQGPQSYNYKALNSASNHVLLDKALETQMRRQPWPTPWSKSGETLTRGTSYAMSALLTHGNSEIINVGCFKVLHLW